ncbi:MAG: O-phosphoserine--tRNA ligase [Candidatus Helarchaeota archaeon]|nr:O-phosphoserine--tRNA ligase [Candidatus Helarchaeota archaeon]
MKFKIKDIKDLSNEDYEKAWIETQKLLKKEGKLFKLNKKGKPHILYDTIEKIRKILIELGFEETVLPMIVEDSTVYKEYGPEAALILDRLFYLAGIIRPDIGISKNKKEMIKKIISNFQKIDILQNIFKEFKKGKIEADDLIEEMVLRLEIMPEQASKIIDEVFPEFKNLTPVPSNLTLRSHTTALWFPVLEALQKSSELPIQLFHIGQKFRREQHLDKTHLYSSYTASIVIEAADISLEDGKRISTEIFKKLGFVEAKFEIKKATSKYYAPQMEFEVFIKHNNEWLEIGDGGFYSPVSLAKFNIEYPVFNLGLGIERLCMIETGITDIRELVYPYFYKKAAFSDEEIAEKISFAIEPRTKQGKEIMKAIISTALKNKDKSAPIEIIAWKGDIQGKNIEITIWEFDKGAKLLGPASLNEIFVREGSILGILPEKNTKGGVSTKIRYLDSLAAHASRKIEELINSEKNEIKLRYRISKLASDININIPQDVRYFITSKNKKIDLRGPIFIGITGKIV